MKRASGLEQSIRELIGQGLRNRDIARQLGCAKSRVSQVRNPPEPVMLSSQAGRPAVRKSSPGSNTCQRPDARKGFAVCGDPKKRTACGETLGVCEYHFETTRPLGGMKL